MTIESELSRIADALEKIASGQATPAPEKPSKPSKPSKPEKPAEKEDDGPSLTDVRKALGALQKKTDAATARGVLKDTGKVGTLSKLDEDLYQAVIDAAEEATENA